MNRQKINAFIDRWTAYEGNEEQGSQTQFDELCDLLDHPHPPTTTGGETTFTFEKPARKLGGGLGKADVWKKDHFGWEYKSPGEDLDAAYVQLQGYRESLGNPPLLVVSDMKSFVIHTNWNNTAKQEYRFTLDQLKDPSTFGRLEALFWEPDELRPDRTPEDLTNEVAGRFADLADLLRDKKKLPPRRVAHFLTQVMFCLFAEDIGLLTRQGNGREGIFTQIVKRSLPDDFELFQQVTRDLFGAMASGGRVWVDRIEHFNGGLFALPEGEEDFFVPRLDANELATLHTAAIYNWSSVEPTIFGTLFERGLNPAKRSQIGAHYTSRADIEAIVEPVLMAPLRREWAAIQERLDGLDDVELARVRADFLAKLGSMRVLDPACGSGNFLYVSLGLLKDLELEVIDHPAFAHLPPLEPTFVNPDQLYGIEISSYAHELASVVVWIGYIQWFRQNGFTYDKRPILERLSNIACKDAVLGQRADGALYKPEWPEVNVIVGNPPFLGGNRIRQGLGDATVDALFELYDELPNFSDLVCYWFERAREQIENGKADRAGLLATQAIRGGANREVLERIKDTGDIFFAYSDREWFQEGVNVHVSMVGFDDGTETAKALDDENVPRINPDLTGSMDLTLAVALPENEEISFRGNEKGGAFDIDNNTAEQMLESLGNPNGRPNSDVVRQWYNGMDITRRPRNMWIIDFGVDMPIEVAAQYELPFEYVKEHVRPERKRNRSPVLREKWWIHRRTHPHLRRLLDQLDRYIVTPHVSKYRLFAWLTSDIVPDHQLIIFARDDDYFFGVLHSKAHEVWALRQGTQLETRPRYTPTTSFQTFPLPWPPGEEPTGDPRYQAIAAAAHELNEKREAWLNPERLPNQEQHAYEKLLKGRTLTNLYNDMPTWLGLLHEKLDRAVFAAYGWDYDALCDAETGACDEEEILRRLLRLNLARAGAE
jgi:type II restriction/modification system DNA methylase subunit YeeA